MNSIAPNSLPGLRVFDGIAQAGNAVRDGTVAIGNFDGLHLGHQALIERAQSGEGPTGVLTFDPHPAKVLSPAFAPPLLLRGDEKAKEMARLGVDAFIVQPFTKAFAKLSPKAFVQTLLIDTLGVQKVVVGHDFSFGHRGAGNVDVLRSLLAPTASLDVVSAVRVGSVVCSSSKLRELVLEGKIEEAATLLGRPYFLEGEVVPGDGRGKKIGIPTANIESGREVLPKVGVYATTAHLRDGTHWPSVTNIGLRPTFGGEGVRVETHLLRNAPIDLYGTRLTLTFAARLRGEQRFGGADELVAQIRQDIAQSRHVLRNADGARQ